MTSAEWKAQNEANKDLAMANRIEMLGTVSNALANIGAAFTGGQSGQQIGTIGSGIGNTAKTLADQYRAKATLARGDTPGYSTPEPGTDAPGNGPAPISFFSKIKMPAIVIGCILAVAGILKILKLW